VNWVNFFPSRTMSLYMGKMFLVRTFAILAGLVLILQSLDLLSESAKILAYDGNSDAEVLRYVGLRTPQIIATFLPFAVLLGTILALSQLNQNSEVIAMKASGLSAHQVLAPLLLTATLEQWKKVDYGPLPVDRGDRSNVWVKDGNNLIVVDQIRGKGDAAQLYNVTVYERSGQSLRSILTAKRGARDGRGWRVEGVQRFDVTAGTIASLPPMRIADGVRPDQFTLSHINADGLSFSALREVVDDLKLAGRPTKALEGSLWHKLSGPLSSVLMPLLGAVAAFGIARSGKLFVRAVIGMALGFLYFVADNFALAMGNLGAYPPFLAAWAPFLLFLMIGEAVLLRTEE
jgi:lipopolysaccharide export system permease protein